MQVHYRTGERHGITVGPVLAMLVLILIFTVRTAFVLLVALGSLLLLVSRAAWRHRPRRA